MSMPRPRDFSSRRRRSRALATFTAVCTVTGLFLLAGVLAPGTASAATCTASVMNIVAHQDDDLLFLNPDIAKDVTAGRCVRTVFLTAGDNNLAAAYWQGRETGIRAAYATMAGVADAWTTSDAGLAGHPAVLLTLAARPTVSLVFLRLPDGMGGGGNENNSFQSLQKLYQGNLGTIRAVDGSTSYTRSSLTAALADLMTSFAPSTVRTQNFNGTYGDGDHSDHISAAYLVRDAAARYTAPHTLVGYMDYATSNLPANVSGADLAAKRAAWNAYVVHDSEPCGTPPRCAGTFYEAWQSRQYTTGTLVATGSVPVGTNVALGRPVSASSVEVAGFEASRAVDGSGSSRWSSGYSDNQWLQVDLGSAVSVSSVDVSWEVAYASSYQVQVSTDGVTWTTVASQSPTAAGTQRSTFSPVTARYVRVNCVTRATGWGFSIYEFAVFGGSTAAPAPAPAPVPVPVGTNVALGRPVSASSVEVAGFEASRAVDGSGSSRWSSGYSDNQWLQVDLGSAVSVSSVDVSWEVAYASSYQVQVSTDGVTWTTVASQSPTAAGTQRSTFSPVTARYVRVNCVTRATGWGFSIYELAVFGGSTAAPAPAPAPVPVPVGTNVALGRPVSASSVEVAGFEASRAVDGSGSSRWSSGYSDNQWLQVDLGSAVSVSSVDVSWEVAYASSYQVQVSTDGVTWTTVASQSPTAAGTQRSTFSPVTARYVRVNCVTRATGWGFSIYELAAYA